MSARVPNTRGFTLVELMIALVILSLGALVTVRFLSLTREAEAGARMRASAGLYARQKVEYLRGFKTVNADLSVGRHPAAGYEDLGTSGAWKRYYTVANMPSPLADLRRVTVIVRWRFGSLDSIRTITYVR